jgi:hypothetical protein
MEKESKKVVYVLELDRGNYYSIRIIEFSFLEKLQNNKRHTEIYVDLTGLTKEEILNKLTELGYPHSFPEFLRDLDTLTDYGRKKASASNRML